MRQSDCCFRLDNNRTMGKQLSVKFVIQEEQKIFYSVFTVDLYDLNTRFVYVMTLVDTP